MALISLEKLEVTLDILHQIRDAIKNLILWNEGVEDMNDLLKSSNGMQALAGNCMLIMAIAEGFKKIDKYTEGQLLVLRPEIPWKQVFGLRNRIAHGYFDINVDFIWDVIQNDIDPLREAILYFIKYLDEIE